MGIHFLIHAPDAQPDEEGDYPDGQYRYLGKHIGYARFEQMRAAIRQLVGAVETPLSERDSTYWTKWGYWVEWGSERLPEPVRAGVQALLCCSDSNAYFLPEDVRALVTMLEWAIPQVSPGLDPDALATLETYLSAARAAAERGWSMEHR